MAVFAREALLPGMRVEGPALVIEAQTTTVVPPSFVLSVNELGYLDLRRRNGEKTS